MSKLVDKLKAKKQNSRTLFLSLKSEIQEALGMGFTGKVIWKQLNEDKVFPYSYPMFHRYFQEYLSDTKSEKSIPSSGGTSAAPDTQASKKGPNVVSQKKHNPFTHDIDPTDDDASLF